MTLLPISTRKLDHDWREYLSVNGTTMPSSNSQKAPYKVSDFLLWQKSGSLILSPFFQRNPTWNAGRKSFLIDTIVRGFPMPSIFLRHRRTTKSFDPLREVVDGQQRLRTIIAFIAPRLLDDYNPNSDGFTISKAHNEDLAGMSFNDLDQSIKDRMLDYEFMVNSLPADTSDPEVVQIFVRMNSGGFKLNAQELRNAMYTGDFKSACDELAVEQYDRWVNTWAIFTSQQSAEMKEIAFTSDLVITMVNGITSNSKEVIESYYKKYDPEFPQRQKVSKRFRHTFDLIDKHIGTDVVREVFSTQAMFYALFVAFYTTVYGFSDSGKWAARPVGGRITADLVRHFKNQGKKIQAGRAIESVLEAKTRRIGHIKERKLLVSYLLPQ